MAQNNVFILRRTKIALQTYMYVCFLKDGIKNWSFNFIAKKLGFHNIK